MDDNLPAVVAFKDDADPSVTCNRVFTGPAAWEQALAFAKQHAPAHVMEVNSERHLFVRSAVVCVSEEMAAASTTRSGNGTP